LIANYRVLSLVHRGMPEDPPPRRKGQPEPRVPRRPFKFFAERELAISGGLAVGAVLVGWLAWWLIERYERSVNLAGDWGLIRPVSRIILVVFVFATIFIFASVFFRHLAMWRMNRTQARIVIQDMFWNDTRREQERIYRWRLWARRGKPNQNGEIRH
jgi:hypothetical protein